MTVKLSDEDRTIMLALQFRGDETVAAVADQLGMAEHVLRHSVRKLTKLGVMRARLWIDPFRLGYRKYQLLFRARGISDEKARQMHGVMRVSHRIAWFAEVGGAYQFAAHVCVQTPTELVDWCNSAVTKFGSTFEGPTLAVVQSFSMYSKNFLAPDQVQREELRIQDTGAVVPLDHADREILAAHRGDETLSYNDIARISGVPRSTVAYRMGKLRESGVLPRKVYFISADAVGRMRFYFLVKTGLDRSLATAALRRYVLENAAIVNYVECLGDWDIRLTAEVVSLDDVGAIRKALFAIPQAHVQEVVVLPIFSQYQSSLFMRIPGVNQRSKVK